MVVNNAEGMDMLLFSFKIENELPKAVHLDNSIVIIRQNVNEECMDMSLVFPFKI